MSTVPSYSLDEQVGFILRQCYQRHATLFAGCFGEEFTPMQWAVIAKLAETGGCSQNMLGRLTAMDVATIKGVVERLIRRTLIEARPDPTDRRRLALTLTPEGHAAYERWAARAVGVSEETLSPLAADERRTLMQLLTRLR